MKRIVSIIILCFIVSIFAQSQVNTDTETEYLKILLDEGKYEEITKTKKRKQKKLSAKGLSYIGLAYFYQDDDQAALKYQNKAINKGPADAEMYFDKGRTLLMLERYEESIKSFDKSIEMDPTIYLGYSYKGESYLQLNQIDSALKYFEKAMIFYDCDARPYLQAGVIYKDKNEYEKSIEVFKKAKDLVDTDDKYFNFCSYNIGLLQQLSGKHNESLQTFKEHIEVFPDDYMAISKIVQAYYAMEDFKEAKPYIDILYKAHDENELPRNMRFMYCIDQLIWNETKVLTFEMFDINDDNPVFSKYKFFISVGDDEIKHKIQLELDTLSKDSTFVLREIRNDTLFTYSNFTYKDTVDHINLKNAVLDILNKKVTPVDTLLSYSNWVTKLRAQNSQLSKLKNDGSSYEKAVVVNSVPEEYNWLAEYYPGYKMIMQSLVFENEKPYDILKIKTADGATIEVYFDISKFFGKGF